MLQFFFCNMDICLDKKCVLVYNNENKSKGAKAMQKQPSGLEDAMRKIDSLGNYDEDRFVHIYFDEKLNEVITILYEDLIPDENIDTQGLLDVGVIYETISEQELLDLLSQVA